MQKAFLHRAVKSWDCVIQLNEAFLPFPKQQILDSSKFKGFEDDYLEFDENGANG